MALTKTAFLAWLREQKPGRRFQRRTDCSCPLACFLDAFVVEFEYYRADMVVKPLPRWAKKFVAAVDANERKTITALDSIRLLEGESDR
jgi:hypothetical protein